MEKVIKIKTPDKHLIYGTLTYHRKKSNKLIVFVHGLTGSQYEHNFFNAAKFFPKRKIDIFRFDLYSDEKKGRRLIETSIKIHSKDFEQVLAHFSKKYKKIYVIGHSLGGPTILFAKPNHINAIVLWDPSINLKGLKMTKWNREARAFIFYGWSINFLLGREMIEDFKLTGQYEKIASKLNVPLKIICAGDNFLSREWKRAIKLFNSPKELVNIKGADHGFNQKGKEEELFKETLKWIRKY